MMNVISVLKSDMLQHFNRILGVFIFALILSAFGFSQKKSNPRNLVDKPNKQGAFVMCDVLPGKEVAQKSPFTLPFKNSEAWPTASMKSGCRYIFKSDDDEAGIAIGLTDLGTAKNALTSYKNAYQASKDIWDEEPVRVIVEKDTGFFSGKDECGLKFHLGKYILDINFKGQFPDVPADKKREAGIELAKMLMARWKRG